MRPFTGIRMKINVWQILVDYFRTLRGPAWTAGSIIDLIVIFGLPLLASFFTYFFKRELSADLFLSLFTLFGVFIAVFMAIQGVLVSLYRSDRRSSIDEAVEKRLVNEDLTRKNLIREVSYTLSYMKLFSLASMCLLIIPISSNSTLFLFQWIAIGLASHLILNLLVILKRMHALFSHEFN